MKLLPDLIIQSQNPTVEERIKAVQERRDQAIQALNHVVNASPQPHVQYKLGDQVWLEGTYLKTQYQTSKLAPKCYGPFQVIKVISPVAYRLQLPTTWKIHNVFHASLLSPYCETTAHGTNFTQPPPDLIGGEEEYEVESILNHQRHGKSRTLQYLIKWKDYPHSDNTWELADQVHALELTKAYHCNQPRTKDKRTLRNAGRRINHISLLPHTGPPKQTENTLPTIQERRHLISRPSSTHQSVLPVASFSDKGISIYSGPWSSHLCSRRGHSPPFLPITTPRLPTQTWTNSSPKKTTIHSLGLLLAPPVVS